MSLIVRVLIFQSLESVQLPTHSHFMYHQDPVSHQTVLETFTAMLYPQVSTNMRCQAMKNEAEELCCLLLWAGNSEAALLGCTSMVRQVLSFQSLQNIPQQSCWKELHEWAHSILCKRQCSVPWHGPGESGLKGRGLAIQTVAWPKADTV